MKVSKLSKNLFLVLCTFAMLVATLFAVTMPKNSPVSGGTVLADTWTDENNITYTYTLNGTDATITNCNNTNPANGIVTFPSYVGPNSEYTVVGVQGVAGGPPSCVFGKYSSFTAITKVILPNNGSFTTIGNFAFVSWLPNLTEVEIPDSVEIIGSSAFRHCASLSSVNIPSGVNEIRDMAFGGTSLSEITMLYNGVVTAHSTTFEDVMNLSKIYVPANQVNAYKADSYWSQYSSIIEAYVEQGSGDDTGVAAYIVLPTILAVTLGAVLVMYAFTFKRKKRV